MRYAVLALIGLLFSPLAIGDEGLDAPGNMIRRADLPANPPRFEAYPAGSIYAGPLAAPDVRSHPRSRLFRTRIRYGARQGVNFAGHYTVAEWGCGAGCAQLAIIDARSGAVFHPKALDHVDFTGVDNALFDDKEGGLLRFRPDSRLIVIIGGVNEASDRRGISYFVWEKNVLRRILFVHKPY